MPFFAKPTGQGRSENYQKRPQRKEESSVSLFNLEGFYEVRSEYGIHASIQE